MGGTIARFAAILALAVPMGACGLSFPVPSLLDDDVQTTGSISLLREPGFDAGQLQELDEEDWRRAKGALAIALDPQGSGAPVEWENPDSRTKGAFAPTNPPTVENNEICRTFKADFSGKTFGRAFQGKACRVSGEEWSIKELAPAKEDKPAKPAAKA